MTASAFASLQNDTTRYVQIIRKNGGKANNIGTRFTSKCNNSKKGEFLVRKYYGVDLRLRQANFSIHWFVGKWGYDILWYEHNYCRKKLKEEKKKGVDNEIITKAKYKHKHTNLLQPSVGLHTILFNTSAPGFRFQH
jgi:hypothetical protein